MEDHETSPDNTMSHQLIQPRVLVENILLHRQNVYEELSGRPVEDLCAGSIFKLPPNERFNRVRNLKESVEKKLSGKSS